MLRKATEQWVTSPLGYNILLSILKDGRPSVKYMQIASHIKEKNICSMKTKLFVSKSYKLKNYIKASSNVAEVQKVDFSKKDNDFKTWVNLAGVIRNNEFEEEFSSKTDYVIANISSLKSAWASCNKSGPAIKIYNSFSYTQDVKYEARLLELPLQSNLQLIILVPNEVDVLKRLYSILRDQGLDAAVRSIQPLFTVKSHINEPNINFKSRIETVKKINGNTKILQMGELNVNKNGVNVTVLSCLSVPSNITRMDNKTPCVNQPFYLAVVYHDVPLFIGQFIQ